MPALPAAGVQPDDEMIGEAVLASAKRKIMIMLGAFKGRPAQSSRGPTAEAQLNQPPAARLQTTPVPLASGCSARTIGACLR